MPPMVLAMAARIGADGTATVLAYVAMMTFSN
jgi:hypothetical protein